MSLRRRCSLLNDARANRAVESGTTIHRPERAARGASNLILRLKRCVADKGADCRARHVAGKITATHASPNSTKKTAVRSLFPKALPTGHHQATPTLGR